MAEQWLPEVEKLPVYLFAVDMYGIAELWNVILNGKARLESTFLYCMLEKEIRKAQIVIYICLSRRLPWLSSRVIALP